MIDLNGKRIWIFFVLVMLHVRADVSLSVSSSEKEPLMQAAVGTPFIIDVLVENCVNPSAPQLQMPDGSLCKQFSFRNLTKSTGAYTVHSVIYSFRARIDKPGTYTIGPATIKNDSNQEETSTIITLDVGDRVIIDQKTESKSSSKAKRMKKHKESESIDRLFVELSVDKKTIVEGETFTLSIRFYTADPHVELHRIVEPEYSELGLVVKNELPSRHGQENNDGTIYSYIEWKREMVAQKSGTITIPACKIDYSERSAHSAFFSFMLGSRVLKTAYSNSLQIIVDQLPVDLDSVAFFGTCTAFKAHVEPAIVDQGEAMTLKIEIEGDVEVQKDTLDLLGIPSSVRIYPSKKYFNKKGTKRVTFEYVVQACGQDGQYCIPAQTLRGYDTIKRELVTVSTHELPFTIVPSVHSAHVGSETTVSMPQEDEEIKPIIRDSWAPYHQRVISWWLFVRLVVIPFLLLGMMMFIAWVRRCAISRTFFKNKYALWQVKRAITCARSQRAPDQLYASMMHYLASIIVSQGEQSDAYDQWMAAVCTQQEFQEWKDFMRKLEEKKFYVGTWLPYNQDDDLYVSALRWCMFIAKQGGSSKKRFALCLALPLMMTVMLQGNDQEYFLQANLQCTSRDWQQALQTYSKIKRKGYSVFFNMGNCAYNLKDYGTALYYWKKALKQAPERHKDDCQFNCNKAYQAIELVQEPAVVSSRFAKISTLVLQLMFLFFWYILLAYWWKRHLFRKRCTVIWVVLLCVGTSLYMRYNKEQVVEGFVMCATDCYAGPDKQYQKAGSIAKAQTVEIQAAHAEWLKVSLRGTTGWVPQEHVLII